MKYDPAIHHRRSIRLKGYDYSWPGLYFITINSFEREKIFGEVVDGEMVLNDHGKIVKDEWLRSFEIRKELYLDEFQIMPHHMHGIVGIIDLTGQINIFDFGKYLNMGIGVNDGHVEMVERDLVGATGRNDGTIDRDHVRATGRSPLRGPHEYNGPRNKTLATFIMGFKSSVTVKINFLRNTPGVPVWQRNYYEHIVRDMDDLERIRRYIRNNPAKWERDRNN